MLQLNTKLVGASICVLAALLACSKSRADTHATSDSGNAVASDDADSPVDTTLDCARIYSPADVAGILNAPAKVSRFTLRSGSCSFDTANDGGSVKVYTGSGFNDEMPWNDVTKSPHRAQYVALPGVGDEAYRSIKDGTEMFSRKGKRYCTVVLMGIYQGGPYTADFTADRDEALAKKTGALCNKAFASK
jgi:hypothetical protein